MTWATVGRSEVPVVPTELVRRMDQEASERYGIDTLQLMEVAGLRVAEVAHGELPKGEDRSVLVICGAGNNGADGLVAARHLAQLAVDVDIWAQQSAVGSLAARHLETGRRVGLRIHDRLEEVDVAAFDLLIDGLLGTGIKPPLRRSAATVVDAINRAGVPVLSIDIPSGLSSDSTEGEDQCVQAELTVMLGVAKAGPMQSATTGRLLLAEIGLPRLMLGTYADRMRAIYRSGPIVELT